MTTPADTHDHCLLGRTPEEYERLRWQARIWEPATAELLDRAGLAPGAAPGLRPAPRPMP
jgi:hypothetical protein